MSKSKSNLASAKYFRRLLLTFAFYLLPFAFVFGQSGVLIPSTVSEKPSDKTLSLAKMDVDILIDNQHATVKIKQIFQNHTAQTLEGKYLFALPPKTSISDFAVWENTVRIPGVIMERRRASGIYGEIKRQTVDPGLLEQSDENGGNSAFSAKVFPINPHGAKRIELEYAEMLAVENLTARFSFPLKPSDNYRQKVGEFNLKIRVVNDFSFAPIFSEAYPLEILQSAPNEISGEYHAVNVELSEDFSFAYRLDVAQSALSVLTYRAPETISVHDLRDPKFAAQNADGYFQANAIFNEPAEKATQPRRVVLLLDTSLSMHGEKLTQAVEAVDFFLHSLKTDDEFNLILFNDETEIFAEMSQVATTENIENALLFVKNSTLGGGTNLKLALETALAQTPKFSGGTRQIVLISDANPTLGTTKIKTLSALFDNQKTAVNVTKFYAFALGNEANESLLKELAEKTHGSFLQVRETEDIKFQLENFLTRIGAVSIENPTFSAINQANFYSIYPTSLSSLNYASLSFIGRYKKPQASENISLTANFGAEKINLTRKITLPEFSDIHDRLPRIWARARVDALLQEMNLDGEREDYINEIIRLAEKHKFVTPYTSFIAAPRALLRPRLIQPGDPVIRVKTDESVREVVAVLPFGEVLPLKFLPSEKVWETRFLAPPSMPDGTYSCRILMTDSEGRGFQETKTFVVDSHAPKIKIDLAQKTFHTNDEILLKVSADKDTSRLTAKLYGAPPTQLLWSEKDKINIGKLIIPKGLASGKYMLTVIAEDFARNQSTAEMQIEIIGE